MNNLKKKFEKILLTFYKKKDFFQKKINKWKTKNKLEKYQQGHELFEKIELLEKELQSNFDSEEVVKNQYALKIKIKEFKKSYKQLNEITKSSLRQWVEAIVFAGALVFVLRTYVFGLYHVPTGSAEPTILVGDRLCGNKFTYFFNDIKSGDYIIINDPLFVYSKNPISYYWQKYAGLGVPILGLPSGPENWTKRVIGVPGDTIEGKLENGAPVIYRNGIKLQEDYVNPYPLIHVLKTTGFIDLKNIGPINIPSFIRKEEKRLKYVYVPEKSLANQPYYKLKPNEVMRDEYYSPVLDYPNTPSYANGRCVDEFGPIRIPEKKYWLMGDCRKNSMDSRFWGLCDEEEIQGKVGFVIFSVDSEEPAWLFELIKHPIDFWKKIRWNRIFKFIN